MPGARFQFFTRAVGAVEWRLISANNWELGRCPSPFENLETCLAAVTEVKAAVDSAVVEVYLDPVGSWRWRLKVEGSPVAVSSRSYSRRIECEGTLSQFRKVAPDAEAVPRLRAFRYLH